MQRIILIYGLISGTVIITSALLIMTFLDTTHSSSLWMGYLVMLIGLSLVFVGIKRYRDTQLGGVIRFGKAFQLGISIALVASVVYVLVWELYLVATHYAFIDEYARSMIDAKRAAGASAAELEAVTAEMAQMKQAYANPLIRFAMTFLEIFPVGLLVTLVSAAILRNSKILPSMGQSS